MTAQINFKGQNYSTDNFISKIVNDIGEQEFYGNFDFYVTKYLFAQIKNDNKSEFIKLKNSFLKEILFTSHNAFISKKGGISSDGKTKISKLSTEVLKSKVQFILIKIKEAENTDKQIKSIAEDLTKDFVKNNDFDVIDFSDTKGTEKIIFLEKLGIINYLRNQEPFNASTNLLASVISGITGIQQSTVQSYINPIISKDVDQGKNPLKKSKTVNKVNQKLLKIGYHPK